MNKEKLNLNELRDTIQDCNINFLIGSGLSTPYLSLLGKMESFLTELSRKKVFKTNWRGFMKKSKTRTQSFGSSGRQGHDSSLVYGSKLYKNLDFKEDTQNNIEGSIQKEQFIEWTKSIWNMNTESARKIGHPAPFPEELPFRLMQLYSFENDIVLDPFMGSGTTAVVGLKNSRRFVGYEINEDYVRIANERISSLQPSLFQNNSEKLSNL